LDVSSVALAERLVDSVASPSESAIQREQYERLHAALEAMPPQDREILTLRHFEHLDHDQAAEALGITLAAARRRYYRALERLRDVISPLLGDGNV
jgi:RNA polymerase sigma-70 factor (ECF subfamily)